VAAVSKKSSTGSRKTTTILASSMKHHGSEIVSLENEHHSKKGKCTDTLSEHQRVVGAKQHLQNQAHSIQDDIDKSEKGEKSSCAMSDASVHVTKVVATSPARPPEARCPKARPPEVVDYGNDKLFANLARVHNYYYEWRA